VHWIGSELCDAPQFDGTGPVEAFLVQMEKVIPVERRIQAMDVMVWGTPAHGGG
jgi:hypothetical protein